MITWFLGVAVTEHGVTVVCVRFWLLGSSSLWQALAKYSSNLTSPVVSH